MIILVTTTTEDREEAFNIIQRIIQEEYTTEVNAVEAVSKALQETHREAQRAAQRAAPLPQPKKSKKPMGFITNPENKGDT